MSDESKEPISEEAAKAVIDGTMTTGSFTIQAQLGKSGRTFAVQGYIYSHNDFDSISNQVDMLHDVVDRQQGRAEIPVLEAELDSHFAALRNAKVHLESLVAKREEITGKANYSNKKKQLDDSEATVQAIVQSIKNIEQQIEKGQLAVEIAKKKYGK
jgi:hypothetical protein